MKQLKPSASKFFIGLILSALFSISAQAEVAVIVNPANGNAIDDDLISKLYLGKAKKFPDGSSATPLDQEEGTAIRGTFMEAKVGKSEKQMKAYWSRLVFTGGGVPPENLASDQAVIDKVASDASAIGYIDAGSVTDAVKVVTSF